MVHRQTFDLPEIEHPVKAMSLDGGKVRLRTPPGEACIWRDYKAVNLHHRGVEAFFQENASLVEWVNAQPLADPVIGVGDGHDGIWHLFAEGRDTRAAVRNFGLVSSGGKFGQSRGPR